MYIFNFIDKLNALYSFKTLQGKVYLFSIAVAKYLRLDYVTNKKLSCFSLLEVESLRALFWS